MMLFKLVYVVLRNFVLCMSLHTENVFQYGVVLKRKKT